MTIKKKIKELLNIGVALAKRWKWYLLIIGITTLYSFVDYWDFGIAIGWGIFDKQSKANPVEGVVAVFLLLTLIETLRTSKEVQRQTKETMRQTELAVRPYMRVSWVTTQIGDNRRSQGIADTCIVITNEGNGLMRRVDYTVVVNGQWVGVRRHSQISPKTSTNMVYKDDTNSIGPLLGCRNDANFDDENNRIIREDEIEIRGSYRDIEGGGYKFKFVSDPTQQAWFYESYRQTKKKS